MGDKFLGVAFVTRAAEFDDRVVVVVELEAIFRSEDTELVE